MGLGDKCSSHWRISAVGGKKGYRLYEGRTYRGYYSNKRTAQRALQNEIAQSRVAIAKGTDAKGKGLSPSRAKSAKGKARAKGKVAKGKGLSPSPATLHYKHVRVRMMKDHLVYHAVVRKSQSREKQYLGSFTDQLQAAEKAADFLKMNVMDIAREKVLRSSPAQSVNRMKSLCKVFAGHVPADLASAIEFRRECGPLHAVAPSVYVAALLGKEDRWKKAVIQIWAAMPLSERLKVAALGSRDPQLQKDGAQAVHNLLTLSAGVWAGWVLKRLGHMPWPMNPMAELSPPAPHVQQAAIEEHAWWNKHVNRNVQSHLSFCPFAIKTGILKKTRNRNKSLGIFNADGEYYAICKFEASIHTEKIMTLHLMGMVLNRLHVPKNNAEWLSALRDAWRRADLEMIRTPEYHWPWLIRSYLIVEMRHNGIKRLKVTRDWDLERLKEACQPDQSGWISMWMKSVAGDSLKKLLKELAYDEPLEMLSCNACLLGDNAISSIEQSKLEQHMSAISRQRREMRSKSGWECNPAIVVTEAMKNNI